MDIWNTVTWTVARAGGLTAYTLLTLAVAVGLALSLRLQSPRWPRIINSELHNFLTLLATIFVGVHVLAVAVDPFTHFGWYEVLIPFQSHYSPVGMAAGILGLYLGLAIGLSTWLRPRIGYALWRKLHVLTLVLYGLVTLHGIVAGSDSRDWWGWGIYLASVALVGWLLLLRVRESSETAGTTSAGQRRAPGRVRATPVAPSPRAGAPGVNPRATASQAGQYPRQIQRPVSGEPPRRRDAQSAGIS